MSWAKGVLFPIINKLISNKRDMRISQSCENKLKEYEGLKLNAYICPAGVITIGWGHTGLVDGKKLELGMSITKTKAQELFEQDIATVEKPLANEPFANRLSQGQWDALVSFIYNIGWGNYKSSTLRKRMNEDVNHADIPNQFRRWNKSNGEVLQGLVKRREWEIKQYKGEKVK